MNIQPLAPSHSPAAGAATVKLDGLDLGAARGPAVQGAGPYRPHRRERDGARSTGRTVPSRRPLQQTRRTY
ncbi:hypothetical protein [Streptosporangium sp. NPDC003464]